MRKQAKRDHIKSAAQQDKRDTFIGQWNKRERVKRFLPQTSIELLRLASETSELQLESGREEVGDTIWSATAAAAAAAAVEVDKLAPTRRSAEVVLDGGSSPHEVCCVKRLSLWFFVFRFIILFYLFPHPKYFISLSFIS